MRRILDGSERWSARGGNSWFGSDMEPRSGSWGGKWMCVVCDAIDGCEHHPPVLGSATPQTAHYRADVTTDLHTNPGSDQ